MGKSTPTKETGQAELVAWIENLVMLDQVGTLEGGNSDRGSPATFKLRVHLL